MYTYKQLLAEAIGTFFLCFAGIGAIVATSEPINSGAGLLGVALAHGLALSIAVSIFAGISGAFWFAAFHMVVNAAYWLLMGLSLVYFWRERQHLAALWMLWAPWLALVAFHSMIYVEARYLFAALPGMYLAAALALSGARTEASRQPETPL